MAGAEILSAAGDIFGGIIGSQMSARQNDWMQQRQLDWEREKLKKEMAYNTEMANTAHQREIADLQAAGLNPVLSAGGKGAPSPTVQGGSIGALPDQSGQILSNAINSGMAQFTNQMQVENIAKNMAHQNDLYDAEKLKAIAETGLANKKTLEVTANTALLKSQKSMVDEQWQQQIWETQLAYYKVQVAHEELKYAKQNAKNKTEILAAERKFKIAEADMKEKENKLWYFSYAWDKGMDIGKILGTIVGLGKFGKIASAMDAYRADMPGMLKPTRSTFGWDKTTGTFY